MNAQIRLSDVVALTEDIPDRGLLRGQVGTVMESLSPGVFEVEFVDNDGRTCPVEHPPIACVALPARVTGSFVLNPLSR